MGTTWSVTLRELPPGQTPASIEGRVVETLENIEALASHWRADSQLSRFNSSRETGPVSVAPHLHQMLATAMELHEKTGGAYDVTIAPLVDLWGFGPQRRNRGHVPPDESIERLMPSIGMQHLQVLPDGSVRKSIPDLRLDLSSIAKGYAIDRVAELLDGLGVRDYLVELGGELRAGGNRRQEGGWRVGLEHPRVSRKPLLHRGVPLKDASMATSGDYRLVFEDPSGGRRFSHILDPRTGRPITHGLAAVSVLSGTAMEADALATALMVLGPVDGYQYAVRERLAAIFVVETHGGMKVRKTDQFPE